MPQHPTTFDYLWLVLCRAWKIDAGKWFRNVTGTAVTLVGGIACLSLRYGNWAVFAAHSDRIEIAAYGLLLLGVCNLLRCLFSAPYQLHCEQLDKIESLEKAASTLASPPGMNTEDGLRLESARNRIRELAAEATTVRAVRLVIASGNDRVSPPDWIQLTRGGLRAIVTKEIFEEYEAILRKKEPRAEAAVFLDHLADSLALSHLRQ